MPTSTVHTEKELLLLISEGDEKAFTELYKLYVPRILPFVEGIVRSRAIADEVIQETFLRLWIGRDKLPAVEVPRAWIFRIASNICYTHLKRAITERNIITHLAEEKEESQPESQAAELTSLIQQAIDKLPAQRKKIYRLSRESGMTISQIAEALGLSPNTVKNTLVSSLQSISGFLKERGYDVPVVIIGLLFF